MAYYNESHQTLGQHPKTKKLARILGISLPTAVGHLQYLWWWALDYAQDGDITRYGHEDISDACLWEGESPPFWLALVQSGFVDDLVDDGRALIHDWPDYGGKLLAKRTADALRKANARKSNGSPSDIPVTAQVEKRREEKTEEKRREVEPSAPRSAKRLTPLSSEEVCRLLEEFPGKEETIELAVSHENAKKYPTNQYGYVRNWLRRDRQWETERNGNGHMGTRANPPGRGSNPQDDPELKRLRALGIIAE